MAGFHQPVAQGAQGVGLAGAGQSEGQDVDAVLHETALGQMVQLLAQRQGHPVVLEEPAPVKTLTGVCIGFHVGAWRVTSRSDLGSGQGSGSSHTRLQNRPRCSNHLSQAMPYRITLTVRPGFSRLLR